MSSLFKWGGRKEDEPRPAPAAAVPPPAPEPSNTSKVLPKVLSALAGQPSPVLMDLGPVVGANISFFGDRLACKFYVEDFFAEVEQHARAGTRDQLGAIFATRLKYPAGSIDGILCWDLFDFLDRAAGYALASRLVPLVRKGGILYGFFGQKAGEISQYTRYIVDTDDSFRLRTSPATPMPRTVHVNRDLNKMFDGLAVTESVLLKNSSRETLFRKL